MRLAIRSLTASSDSRDGMCTGVSLKSGSPQTGGAAEILSAGDHQKILRWHQKDGTMLGELCTVDSHITTMTAHGGDEAVVVGCSDGTIRFINSTSGKEERRAQQTHKGSVTHLRWDHGGQLLCSCGEDGSVKVWSRTGMIRSQLAQVSTAVSCAAWSPDSETLAFTCGSSIHLKTLVAGRGLIQWKAVDSGPEGAPSGEVLCLDWSPVTKLIVSGAEDCRYRIWDASGLLLYRSDPLDHAVTAVQWTPNGKLLAVGICDMIELCDATGWGHSHTNLSGLHLDPASYNQQYRSTAPGSGSSPLALCWSQDGTQLIMGMGDGSVLTADVVGRSCSWLNVEAVLTDAHTVVVKDYTTEATEETIDFTDRVTDLRIAHGYLVVTTSSQCFVYDGIATSVGLSFCLMSSLSVGRPSYTRSPSLLTTGGAMSLYARYSRRMTGEGDEAASWLTSPIVEDLRDSTSLIVQCSESYCLVDAKGIGIYAYDRRNRLSYLRPPREQRLDFLTHLTVAVSKDTLVYVDPSNPCSLCIYDLLSSAGGPSSKGPMVLPHSVEITQVGLSQIGGVADRKLAFLDKNGDLWLTAGYPQYISIKATGDDRTPKLKAMVSSFQWNDATDMLVGIADQQLITWNYPQCIFTDSQLLNLTVDTMEIPRQSIGESSAGSWGAGDTTVETFIGTRVLLKRPYGGRTVTAVSPYPSLLYKLQAKGQWDKAVKLCRYVRVKELWGTLAAMAMKVNDAGNTLETALAAISDVCKMSMLRHAKGQSDPIVKQAEIMLLSRRANEAIQLLVANRKIYRAIKFNIWLHRWEAALDLAVQHRTHVDTVLAYRMRHLEAMKHSENNEKFRRYAAEVPVDWTSVKAKIAREKAEERASGVDTPVNQSKTALPLEIPGSPTLSAGSSS
ncbi:Intraflagellar transport protein 80 [Perkinsus olseni]|uniref:Intraflagellar transport protein 80 n=2 Tax=Perkinsus olseni TaxID=32597 RepID=A0A7J6UCK0_PEROL|nr:Intraflagellar transport protein 80 [Perkinsus olseni]